jgi:hypothetical protein
MSAGCGPNSCSSWDAVIGRSPQGPTAPPRTHRRRLSATERCSPPCPQCRTRRGSAGRSREIDAGSCRTPAGLSGGQTVRRRSSGRNFPASPGLRRPPATEELDLGHLQADPSEARRGCGPASFGEGVTRLLTEAGAGQREEARDQLMTTRRVSHGTLRRPFQDLQPGTPSVALPVIGGFGSELSPGSTTNL